MDKLIVRGTEINVQWDLKRDDFLSLTDIAKIKDNDTFSCHIFRNLFVYLKLLFLSRESFTFQI